MKHKCFACIWDLDDDAVIYKYNNRISLFKDIFQYISDILINQIVF